MFHVARRELQRKDKEISQNSFGTTYSGDSVALENAGVDRDICTVSGINSSTLEVACAPPGIGAKKIQEISLISFKITYKFGSVALECGVVDLHNHFFGINSTTLEALHVPRPDIEQKFELVLFPEKMLG
jgi:hypothetical protein